MGTLRGRSTAHATGPLLCLAALGVVISCDTVSPSPDLAIDLSTTVLGARVVEDDGGLSLRCDIGVTATAAGEEGASAVWGGAAVDAFTGTARDRPAATLVSSADEIRSWFGARSIGPGQEQALELYFHSPLPFHGRLKLSYHLEPGGEEHVAEAAFDCGPPAVEGPGPTLDSVGFSPETPEPGDPLRVRAAARGPVGLWAVRVDAWTDGWSSTKYAVVEPGATSWRGELEFFLPWTIAQGDPIRAEVTVTDVAGAVAPVAHVTSGPVTDGRPPGGDLQLSCQRCFVAVGDTVRLAGGAVDASAYWLVYRVGDPAVATDSVSFAAGPTGVDLPLVPDSSWMGVQSVSLRYGDVAGHGTAYQDVGEIRVFPTAEARVDLVEIDGRVTDIALDTRRGRVYLARPGRDEVLVLRAADLERLDAVAIAGAPHGVELTASGDSLLVSLADSGVVVILDPDGIRAADRLPLTALQPADRALFVRAAANGRWLIHAEAPGDGLPYNHVVTLLEVDPVTRTESVLDVHGSDGSHRLVATDDRTRIVTAAACARIYESHAGALGPCHYVASPEMATDASGSLFSDGWFLYDAGFQIRTIDPPTTGYVEAVDFTPDGRRLLVVTPAGVDVVDVETWALVFRLDGTLPGGRLEVAPGGEFGIAWGAFDLRAIPGVDSTSVARVDLEPVVDLP